MTANQAKDLIAFKKIVEWEFTDFCDRSKASDDERRSWAKDWDNMDPLSLISHYLMYRNGGFRGNKT